MKKSFLGIAMVGLLLIGAFFLGTRYGSGGNYQVASDSLISLLADSMFVLTDPVRRIHATQLRVEAGGDGGRVET